MTVPYRSGCKSYESLSCSAAWFLSVFLPKGVGGGGGGGGGWGKMSSYENCGALIKGLIL